jgi:hypothetical protein
MNQTTQYGGGQKDEQQKNKIPKTNLVRSDVKEGFCKHING